MTATIHTGGQEILEDNYRKQLKIKMLVKIKFNLRFYIMIMVLILPIEQFHSNEK